MRVTYGIWVLVCASTLCSQQTQQAKLLFDIDKTTSPSASDPNPGPRPRFESKKSFFVWGKQILFQASRFDTGFELAVSDGTQAGTRILKDLYPGITSSYPHCFRATHDGSRVFFIADGKGTGYELYVTDGTSSGTQLVRDFNPGRGRSYFRGMAPFSKNLMMFLKTSISQRATELWVSDGRSQGTKRIATYKDLLNAPVVANLFSPSPKSPMYFSANLKGKGWEPWVSLGTAQTTRILKDIRVGSASSGAGGFALVSKGRVLFAANDGVVGKELWITDGTNKGTTLLTDLEKGPRSGVAYLLKATLGNTAFFVGMTKKTGSEIYASDGTAKGTQLLVDARPGQRSGHEQGARLVASGTEAFFSARTGTGKVDVFRTMGTSATTSKMTPRSLTVFPESMAGLQGKLYFEAEDCSPGTGTELCRADGKTMKTLVDLFSGRSSGRARFLTRLGKSTVLFAGMSSADNTELHAYDPSSGLVALDINHRNPPITESSRPYSTIPFGQRLLIFADNGVHGREPWISDGSKSGTHLLKDIVPGKTGSHPRYPCLLGDRVFFQAQDPKLGLEMFVTDGTKAGTRLFNDFAPGKASFGPWLMTTVGGRMYFMATDSTGFNPWVTDGTVVGTHRLANVLKSKPGAQVLGFAGYGQRVVFLATFPSAGAQLWLTDGTSKGTRLLRRYPKGRQGPLPRPIAMQGRVYFNLDFKLHVSDFTAAGTKTIDLSSAGILSVVSLVTNGERLYLLASSRKHGKELFTSDGTSAGTRLFVELAPGTADANVLGMDAVGSRRLYFTSVAFRKLGFEHHRSDGTQKGTISYDVYPGGLTPFWSSLQYPGLMASLGDRAYFAPLHDVFGSEIFSVENGATATVVGSSSAGSWLIGTDPVMGSQAVLRGASFEARSVHVTILGFPPVRALPFAGSQWLHVDPSRFWMVAFAHTGSSFRQTIPIPNLAILQGSQLTLQTLSLDPKLGAQIPRLSNGLAWTLGR